MKNAETESSFERMLRDIERTVVEIHTRLEAQCAELAELRSDVRILRTDTVSGFAAVRAEVLEALRQNRALLDRQSARIDALGERIEAVERKRESLSHS
jgi:hypothetical protein